MSKLGWGREVQVDMCSCECGEVNDEFVADTDIRSG
jgi:hypothetical protein